MEEVLSSPLTCRFTPLPRASKVALVPCKTDRKPLGPRFNGVASTSQDEASNYLRKAFKSEYGSVHSPSRAS
jgi:hypothetical protein